MKNLGEMTIQKLRALEQEQHDIVSKAGTKVGQLINHQRILGEHQDTLKNTKSGLLYKKERAKINKNIDDTINNMMYLLSEDTKKMIEDGREKRPKNKKPKYDVQFLSGLGRKITAQNEASSAEIDAAKHKIVRIQSEFKVRAAQAVVKTEESEEKVLKKLMKTQRLKDISSKKPYSFKLRFWDWVRRVVVFFTRNPENKLLAKVNEKIDAIRGEVKIPVDLVAGDSSERGSHVGTNPFAVLKDSAKTKSEHDPNVFNSEELGKSGVGDSELVKGDDLDALLADLEKPFDGQESEGDVFPPLTRSTDDLPRSERKKKKLPPIMQKPELFEGESSETEVEIIKFGAEKSHSVEKQESSGESDKEEESIVLSSEDQDSRESQHESDRLSARVLAARRGIAQFSVLGKMTVEGLKPRVVVDELPKVEMQKPELFEGESSETEVEVVEFKVEEKSHSDEKRESSSESSDEEEESTDLSSEDKVSSSESLHEKDKSQHDVDRRSARALAASKGKTQFSVLGKMTLEDLQEKSSDVQDDESLDKSNK